VNALLSRGDELGRRAQPALADAEPASRLSRGVAHFSPIRSRFGACRCAQATRSCAVRGESFAHDPLDRSSTAPASYGAAEATINFLCTERLFPPRCYDVTNVVVTQYIA
jgi:hypothetical protein